MSGSIHTIPSSMRYIRTNTHTEEKKRRQTYSNNTVAKSFGALNGSSVCVRMPAHVYGMRVCQLLS